jgi:hypothetical protein
MNDLAVMLGDLLSAPSSITFFYFLWSEPLCKPDSEECFPRIDHFNPNLGRTLARHRRRR